MLFHMMLYKKLIKSILRKGILNYFHSSKIPILKHKIQFYENMIHLKLILLKLSLFLS